VTRPTLIVALIEHTFDDASPVPRYVVDSPKLAPIKTTRIVSDAKALGQAAISDASSAATALLTAVGGSVGDAVPVFGKDVVALVQEFVPGDPRVWSRVSFYHSLVHFVPTPSVQKDPHLLSNSIDVTFPFLELLWIRRHPVHSSFGERSRRRGIRHYDVAQKTASARYAEHSVLYAKSVDIWEASW